MLRRLGLSMMNKAASTEVRASNPTKLNRPGSPSRRRLPPTELRALSSSRLVSWGSPLRTRSSPTWVRFESSGRSVIKARLSSSSPPLRSVSAGSWGKTRSASKPESSRPPVIVSKAVKSGSCARRGEREIRMNSAVVSAGNSPTVVRLMFSKRRIVPSAVVRAGKLGSSTSAAFLLISRESTDSSAGKPPRLWSVGLALKLRAPPTVVRL